MVAQLDTPTERVPHRSAQLPGVTHKEGRKRGQPHKTRLHHKQISQHTRTDRRHRVGAKRFTSDYSTDKAATIELKRTGQNDCGFELQAMNIISGHLCKFITAKCQPTFCAWHSLLQLQVHLLLDLAVRAEEKKGHSRHTLKSAINTYPSHFIVRIWWFDIEESSHCLCRAWNVVLGELWGWKKCCCRDDRFRFR